jgi:hypothetical protein
MAHFRGAASAAVADSESGCGWPSGFDLDADQPSARILQYEVHLLLRVPQRGQNLRPQMPPLHGGYSTSQWFIFNQRFTVAKLPASASPQFAGALLNLLAGPRRPS